MLTGGQNSGCGLRVAGGGTTLAVPPPFVLFGVELLLELACLRSNLKQIFLFSNLKELPLDLLQIFFFFTPFKPTKFGRLSSDPMQHSVPTLSTPRAERPEDHTKGRAGVAASVFLWRPRSEPIRGLH